MSLLRKFFGPAAVIVPAPVLAPEPPAPLDDSEPRLAAALALGVGEEREAALLALAGSSRIPAVRLKAAAALTSPASWQALLASAQDRDRRVWKLMKDRIAGVRQQERAHAERSAIIAGLEEILTRRPVDLVRLVDLDKRWELIQAMIEAGPLADVRASVSTRIENEQKAQFELRRIIAAASTGEAQMREAGTDPAKLENEAGALSALLASIDPADAPPAQLAEAQGRVAAFNDTVANAKQDAQQYVIGRARAQELLGQIERLEAASLELCQNMQADWNLVKLGSTAEDEDLKQRFAAGIAVLKAPHAEAEAAAREKAQQQGTDKKQMQERLRLLITETEAALEQGAAAVAIKLNDQMRVLRNQVGQLSPGWKSRLSVAEKQVAKLRGWQRFTGEKLREELIIAAEKLKESHLTPDLLGKEITLVQDEWKKLDTQQEGGAPKPLWERFHAATAAAYERVKVYREQQGKEREANAEARRALIAEAAPISQLFAEGVPPPPPEAWKALVSQRSSLHDRWHAAGPVNRNEMKELQAQFASHMKALDAASNFARKQEKERKNALIAEVDAALTAAIAAVEAASAVDPAAPPEAAPAAPPAAERGRNDRNERGGRGSERGNERGGRDNDRGGRTERGNERGAERGNDRRGPPNRNANVPPALITAMRIAQETQKRWQEERHPMPLPRKEEQQLWEAFRAKCSAIFALRDAKREEEKGKAAAQEGTRALVINNVAALGEAADPVAAAAHLQQLLTEWNAMERPDNGARKRFDDAVARARNRIDGLKREAAAAIAGKLLAFDAALCKIEQSQAEGASASEMDIAAVTAQQEELAKSLSRHKGLKARAERVAKGTAAPADWSKLVAAGSQTRLTLLLDLELTLGVDSPPEFASARRMRQLERLADAMKNRAVAKTAEEMFEALLAIPAAPSESSMVRLAAVVAQMEKPRR
ncbi:MAG: hypothetical protein JWN73_355 [Betaproteobacteria bacterium]|nr:hypothetical protein [Betaproteobacteria bacterium]